ncbi:YycH family regulatory protein [Halobacillus seohaensis]|uniref:YycH family regulatory protein n=1 Tax=Halobacillus seohaensis TaxID=447421 RepID=A0ABW2EIN1_9BACI
MKVETLKSIILFILIGFSLLLTVAQWNYQPNVDSLDEEGFIEETTINGEEVELTSLIAPSQFVFHKEASHYSYTDKEDAQLMFGEMKNWTMSNLLSTAHKGPPEQHEQMVEVVFPTDIPAQVIPNLFEFENDNQNAPAGHFNRIFFMVNEGSDRAEVLFVSDGENSTSFRATLRSGDTDGLKASMNNDEKFIEQILFADDEEKRIFIPRDSVTVAKDSVDSQKIDILPLRNELLSDSPVVRDSSSSTSELRLTDDSRRLEVPANGNRLEYSTLTSNASSVQTALSSFDLLERSVSFINTHKGWTDSFQLSDLNPSQSSVQFNMYFNSLPLLSSSDDFHKIEVEYDGDQERSYVRPLRDFDTSYPSPNEEGELPSGENVASFLEETDQYNMKLIEDIMIGYKLSQQTVGYEVYDLIPSWFVLENGSWKEITELSSEEEGGQANAVGPN